VKKYLLDLLQCSARSLRNDKVNEGNGQETSECVDLNDQSYTILLKSVLTNPIIGPRPASVGWNKYGKVNVTAQAVIQNMVVPIDRCF
jgi:hypothetical protein